MLREALDRMREEQEEHREVLAGLEDQHAEDMHLARQRELKLDRPPQPGDHVLHI